MFIVAMSVPVMTIFVRASLRQYDLHLRQLVNPEGEKIAYFAFLSINLLMFTVAFVGVLVLTGYLRVKDAVSTTPQFGVVALLDISASTEQEALRQRYQKELLGIIGQLALHGAVIPARCHQSHTSGRDDFPGPHRPKMSVIDKNEFSMEETVKNAKDSAGQELHQTVFRKSSDAADADSEAIEVTSRIFQT